MENKERMGGDGCCWEDLRRFTAAPFWPFSATVVAPLIPHPFPPLEATEVQQAAVKQIPDFPEVWSSSWVFSQVTTYLWQLTTVPWGLS